MKYSILIMSVIFVFSCNKTKDHDAVKYFDYINRAELLVCKENFSQALDNYNIAFQNIHKPFGKDVFNAALCSQLTSNISLRNKYLQALVNNSDNYEFLKSKFLDTYLSHEEWDKIIANRQIKYNPTMRQEFWEIQERDKLFRPMYDTHDDTINVNRKINLERILDLNRSTGFPSQVELGYTNNLRGQYHDIVLHHTSQRRSRDKSVLDLEPILYEAVNDGRFDPETAIFYMNFQNDLEKGRFEVYSTWQYKHPLLPDSLNRKIWLPKLSKEQKLEANRIRKVWHANSIDEIAQKTAFLANSHLPFIFTSVRKSIRNLRSDFDIEKAFEQYQMPTLGMEEYKDRL